MSIENPEELLSIQDSLLGKKKNDVNILDALVSANNRVAEKYRKQGDYISAAGYFKKATKLNTSDVVSKYGLLLADGNALVKKGNKNGMWDAIEKYSKAATLYPKNGEPFYWMAIAYTKLGETDFDLILESYEKALSLELDNKLRTEAEKRHKLAKERKNKLDSFWK
jgi:tetratricopeptide (TPR) repeat protein